MKRGKRKRRFKFIILNVIIITVINRFVVEEIKIKIDCSFSYNNFSENMQNIAMLIS
jgi:hypothetical protein